jgi:hypothetical protein
VRGPSQGGAGRAAAATTRRASATKSAAAAEAPAAGGPAHDAVAGPGVAATAGALAQIAARIQLLMQFSSARQGKPAVDEAVSARATRVPRGGWMMIAQRLRGR